MKHKYENETPRQRKKRLKRKKIIRRRIIAFILFLLLLLIGAITLYIMDKLNKINRPIVNPMFRSSFRSHSMQLVYPESIDLYKPA